MRRYVLGGERHEKNLKTGFHFFGCQFSYFKEANQPPQNPTSISNLEKNKINNVFYLLNFRINTHSIASEYIQPNSHIKHNIHYQTYCFISCLFVLK